MRFLKSRHHSLNSVLQGAILARVNEARTEDRAERPFPKKQAAPLQLFSELLVRLERCFRVKKRMIMVNCLAQIRHGAPRVSRCLLCSSLQNMPYMPHW